MNTKNISGLLAMFVCLIVLAGCSDKSKKTSAPVPAPVVFDYQSVIEKAVSDAIPGIVLLVETPDLKFLGAAGLADIETQEPMQTYHVMPSGSAGKKLTALLTVLLEQEGLLSLEDKINTILDEEILSQIEHSDNITIRQLLNHTSGVFDYLDNEDAFYNTVLSSDVTTLKLDNFALAFALNQPAYAFPGEEFHYSNTGYVLIGLILNKLLGEHHSIAMRNRIFSPLGMNTSFYGGIEKDMGEIISGYYIEEDGSILNTKPFFEYLGTADAPLRSNVEDLAFLLKYIVSSDSTISKDVQARFFSEDNVVRVDESVEYGLGIFRENMNGNTVYHHGGLEPGYSTSNIFIEDTKTSITIFFNCGVNTQCETESDKVVQTILLNELK